jgi:hypothetical protein
MNVRPPAAPEAAKTPPPADAPALDIDYSKLPVLTQAIRKKLDLDELRINMLRPVDKTRPYASALINLNTVYVGEAIPRTRARLVAVDELKGIVIEFDGSKERFYVRF